MIIRARKGAGANAPVPAGGVGPVRLQHALRIEGVTKAYGPTVANDAMTFEIRAGEIHGLLGQNGAGKSTLVGILTGHIQPDSGRVLADDRPADLSSGEAALAAGIVAVYQTPMLVASMTGLENVALALGRPPTVAIAEQLDGLAEQYGLPLELDVPVERLDMAARLRIEFARALCQDPKVLLLDEPTTFLPPTQVDDFLECVRRLADSGVAVLMITHRLDEARRVCDQVTVIRSGAVVARYTHRDLPGNDALATAMLGEAVTEPEATGMPGTTKALSVTGLYAPASDHSEMALADIDLDVHVGEIVGIAGVDGNGQMDLLDAIAGVRTMSGSISLEGREVSSLPYVGRFHLGLQLLSGDRRRHGVVPELTVFEHFDFALDAPERDDVLARLAACDTRPLDLDIPATALSGGNQQKVMLTRALMAGPRVLMLAYPTQGLDVSAAATIHAALLDHARRGLGVVVVSSDLDELLGLCDRIVVMYRGRLVGTQRRGEIDRRVLGQWFTGSSEHEEHELVVH
ncbi:MAG: Simple sugar transport system ATP-binding protein [Acidimicrobiales bacterium]|nr:Simple sugar transport system ATP-binding protein [Acidimicrobiales bacterium]